MQNSGQSPVETFAVHFPQYFLLFSDCFRCHAGFHENFILRGCTNPLIQFCGLFGSNLTVKSPDNQVSYSSWVRHCITVLLLPWLKSSGWHLLVIYAAIFDSPATNTEPLRCRSRFMKHQKKQTQEEQLFTWPSNCSAMSCFSIFTQTLFQEAVMAYAFHFPGQLLFNTYAFLIP